MKKLLDKKVHFDFTSCKGNFITGLDEAVQAIKLSANNIKYVNPDLLKKKENLDKLLDANNEIFRFLPLVFRRDSLIAEKAISKNPTLLAHASLDLRRDRSFCLNAVCNKLNYYSFYPAILYVDDTLKSDESFMFKAISYDISNFLYATISLKKDVNFLSKLMYLNSNLITLIDDDLFKNNLIKITIDNIILSDRWISFYKNNTLFNDYPQAVKIPFRFPNINLGFSDNSFPILRYAVFSVKLDNVRIEDIQGIYIMEGDGDCDKGIYEFLLCDMNQRTLLSFTVFGLIYYEDTSHFLRSFNILKYVFIENSLHMLIRWTSDRYCLFEKEFSKLWFKFCQKKLM